MSHGIGVTEALQALPDVVVLLFGLVTQLGDLWFYFLWLTVAYAYGHTLPYIGRGIDRERVAFLVALAVGAYALTESLKVIFAHPRPPGAGTAPTIPWIPALIEPLVTEFTTADGFSLPSGHAIGSTVVYGGAALLIGYARRAVSYIAAVIVALVALSRAVLGVHYLTDVVFGVLIGAAYLEVVFALGDEGRASVRAFAVAAVVAVPGVVVHFSPDTVGALGGALGGLIAWWAVDDRVTGAIPDGEPLWTLAFGLPVGGTLIGIGYVLDSFVLAFVGFAGALAVVLVSPLVVRKVSGDEMVDAEPAG